ncbi:O-methylsterigmatocystin oxidoreductase [Rhizoctonia solani]|uniref:O-methylsterigmatocystin oxidoreductase n=1 Tax=Rhizoctonia solani TaxID=456999 RepID=A0A0K6G869_9AGAM|nr:O-methylsterigmatocystin oxidoreductase [Rhizoctonia solani]
MTGSTLLMAAYGYEVTSPDHSLFKTVKIASDEFIQAAVAPNFLVNTFPWLEYVPEWFPGATWKAKASLWRTQKDRMLHVRVPYNWIKNKMSTKTEVPSMVSTWLKKYVHQQSTAPIVDLEERIKWIAGGLFAAGSDTSVSVLRTFIIAMAMHPDVQAKAQAEIDSGPGVRTCMYPSRLISSLRDSTPRSFPAPLFISYVRRVAEASAAATTAHATESIVLFLFRLSNTFVFPNIARSRSRSFPFHPSIPVPPSLALSGIFTGSLILNI